jgi:enamine deaminase RidA (YjgF/YER057c/UK114 family)
MISKCFVRLARPFSINGRFFSQSIHGQTEQRLQELGLVLPTPGSPKGNYISWVRVGNVAYLSGHLPIPIEGPMLTGTLGKELELKDGYEAARLTSLQLLATMQKELGTLDRVERIVRLGGFVQSTSDFKDQALVMNGCSDLFLDVLQDRSYHVRTSVACNTLPLDVAVEIDAIVQIRADLDNDQ